MKKSIHTEDYQTFLNMLKEARIAAGLTQEDLASRLDETQSFISKCERGERRLDIVEVRTFCAAIGVSFAAFVKQLDEGLR